MSINYALSCRGVSPIDMDIPYIQNVLITIQKSQAPLTHYDLHSEIPLVVVDPGVIKNE